MDAIVMCGGDGSRLESTHEKPLYPLEGAPLIDRVCRGLEDSTIETIYAAVSPKTPDTRAHLERFESICVIETAGDGYVTDLLSLLERPSIEQPVFTVAADLPLLEAAVVDRILERYGGRKRSLTVCVPTALKRRLGVSVDTTLEATPHLAPTGVNVVGTTDESMSSVTYDSRLAVNVNRRTDARVASTLLGATDKRGTDWPGGEDPCE